MKTLKISKASVNKIVELSGRERNWGREKADAPDLVRLVDVPDKDLFDSDLADFIFGLTPEEKLELNALIWIGRGTSDADDFDGTIEYAKQNYSGDESSETLYIVEKPLFRYLPEAVTMLQARGIQLSS